jgi:hypothetical protein
MEHISITEGPNKVSHMKVVGIKGGEKWKQNYCVPSKDTAVGVNCRNVDEELRKVLECIQEHTFGGNGVIGKEQQSI